MKKILLPFLLIIVLVGCENTNEVQECLRFKDFEAIQTEMTLYDIFTKNGNLYAFYTNYTYGSSGDTVFVEVRKSLDNGRTWDPVCKIMTDKEKGIEMWRYGLRGFIESVDGTFWIACYPGNIFKSTDKGDTWQKREIPITTMSWNRLNGHNMRIDNEGTLYLCSITNGIFRSMDDASTWTRVVSESPSYYTFMEYYDEVIFFRDWNDYLMLSFDNGDSWSKPSGIKDEDMRYFGNEYGDATHYSLCKGDDGVFYLSICHLNYFNYPEKKFQYIFYKSFDNGHSWQGGIINYDLNGLILYDLIGVSNNGEMFASFYGCDVDLYWEQEFDCSLNEGIYKSIDGGQSWTKVFDMPIPSNHEMTKDNYVLFYEDPDFSESNPNILRISKKPLY